jgi:hypothetical protein
MKFYCVSADKCHHCLVCSIIIIIVVVITLVVSASRLKKFWFVQLSFLTVSAKQFQRKFQITFHWTSPSKPSLLFGKTVGGERKCSSHENACPQSVADENVERLLDCSPRMFVRVAVCHLKMPQATANKIFHKRARLRAYRF